MSGLTAAQVWYVTRVYAEHVTPDEAQESYAAEVWADSDRSYWESSAKVLTDIALDSNVKRALEILKSTVKYGSLSTPGANRSEIIHLLKTLDVEGVPDA